MGKLEELKSLKEFLFEAPLYKTYQLPADLTLLKVLYGYTDPIDRGIGGRRVDGHCAACGRTTTYTFRAAQLPAQTDWKAASERTAIEQCSITCARVNYHNVRIWFYLSKMTIQKIGQYPSLADIANDEVREYRSSMAKVDGQELHKAIGLAAHGVGVGSFVYLRRVFERLVTGRFDEFKGQEGWSEEEFSKLRMVEKVRFLNGHLPTFLVENAGIYSILSSGIHELSEDTCLGAFGILKESILVILQEDKKKKEELAQKAKLQEAIKRFSGQNDMPT